MFLFVMGVLLACAAYLYFDRKKGVVPGGVALDEVIHIQELEASIDFYGRLNAEEKLHFQQDLLDFFRRVAIVGIGTELTRRDKLLVGASAVIPVFRFPQWQYYELDEVLVFASAINLQFETHQPDSQILGLVGTGKLDRKMVLTREALEEGFSNKTDTYNVGIHEFIHIIDKEDGRIDGLPKVLIDKQYAIPWLRLIRAKILEIQQGRSDIDTYGATNLSEFLAVSGEYFFERPDLLKAKHPELFNLLELMFSGRLTH